MPRHDGWNESLFGCCNDCGICLCGWCFAPCLFGKNAENIDGSKCCPMCCTYYCLGGCLLCWIPHFFKRTDLREKYGLQEDPKCPDLPTTIFCGPCALCQEARFLKNRVKYEEPGGLTGVVSQPPDSSRRHQL